MGNITVTAGSVARTDGHVVKGTAGDTTTAGQVKYFDASAGTWKSAQCDGTAAEAGTDGIGIALNGAATGQPVDIQINGRFNPGGTCAAGQVYSVSATAALIALSSDPASTNYQTVLGVGLSTSIIKLQPIVSGVVI